MQVVGQGDHPDFVPQLLQFPLQKQYGGHYAIDNRHYYIGDDIWHSACCPHKGALLPAGDAHIVYPGPEGPWRSMRPAGKAQV